MSTRPVCRASARLLSVVLTLTAISCSDAPGSDDLEVAPQTDTKAEEAPLRDELVPALGSGELIALDAERRALNSYQMGDEWGKREMTASVLATVSPALQRAARATARTGGATGFYLGEFDGRHLMATNHHVFPQASACEGRSVSFTLLGRSFRCARWFGSWREIDVAIFEITVPSASDAALLAEVAGNFAFDRDITPDMELVTVGFGGANNPGRRMVGNEDSDCRAKSAAADYRLMADPDEVNPGDYETWSFAHACDISHGDSGSSIVARDTGEVVGIVWTGRIPKSPKAQTSAYLTQLSPEDPEVWSELNYAVPAARMGPQLRRIAGDPETSELTARVLRSLLGDPLP